MRAVVMGGTGMVGLQLLQALGRARVPTVSLARHIDVGVSGIEWRVLDSMQIGPRDIPAKATVAFCALGTTIAKAGSQAAFRAVDRDLVLRFAQACQDAKVPAFHVVSAAGANPKSRIFYNRVKGEMEAGLQKLGFTTLAIYRPGLLLGERQERRRGERILVEVCKALGPALPRNWRGMPAATLASAMLREARSARAGVRILLNKDIHLLGK